MFQSTSIESQSLLSVTAHVRNRWPLFRDPVFAREAVECLYRIQIFNPFFLFGFVIMPDHCRFLLHVPDSGSLEHIMEMYKRAVTFGLDMGAVWQSRIEVRVPDCAEEVLRSIHHHPVRERLCNRPEDYKWSSASGRWDVMELGGW